MARFKPLCATSMPVRILSHSSWSARLHLQEGSEQNVQTSRALNDLVARAFASAAIPVAKEPQGLSRADGKRPNGLKMVPWREGKPLTWDVTVVCPLTESYISDSATNAGSAAEAAATRKAAKYAV